jgi:hypothetical protein
METTAIVKSRNKFEAVRDVRTTNMNTHNNIINGNIGKHFINYHFTRPLLINFFRFFLLRKFEDFHFLCHQFFCFIISRAHFAVASCVHAYVCLLLDTHSLNYENLFIHIRVLFTKAFRASRAAPNVKSLWTREALNSNWSWNIFNRSSMGAKEVERETKRETSSALAMVQFENDV